MTASASAVHPVSGVEATAGVGTQDHRVMVGGVSTQYLEAGTGPTLLLLHGQGQSAAAWQWVIPALARTHHVLALSLPGHGETDPTCRFHAPGRDAAPFVSRFLDTVAVAELDVVGNSTGGAVALRLALADPRRPRTLTLVDSACLGRAVNPLLVLDALPMFGEMAMWWSRVPGGGILRTALLTAMLFAQPSRVPSAFLAEQHALARLPGRLEASTTRARAILGPTGQREVLLDELSRLHMPTFVMWGEHDNVLPVHQAHTAVGRLPHGHLTLFPDCGHLPHVELPERFAAVLGAFLAEHDGAGCT